MDNENGCCVFEMGKKLEKMVLKLSMTFTVVESQFLLHFTQTWGLYLELLFHCYRVHWLSTGVITPAFIELTGFNLEQTWSITPVFIEFILALQVAPCKFDFMLMKLT